jgi:hypothetical protein
MEELIKVEVIPHTGLSYLYRTRTLHHDEVEIKYSKQLVTVEELRRRSYARLTVVASLTEATGRKLMDIFYPEGEQPHWNSDKLFDGYFKTKEDMITNPKRFHAQHSEPSTANLKRTDKTRDAEIERVNSIIEAEQDNINARLVESAMIKVTEKIDAEMEAHNKEVREKIKHWLMQDGINEDWIINNLYSNEQRDNHRLDEMRAEDLYKHIKEFQEEYSSVVNQKNTRKRTVFKENLLTWAANAPELVSFIDELDINQAHDREIRFLSL